MKGNPTVSRACVWTGPACLFLFACGLIISGYLVPSHPSRSAEATARSYAENATSIRIGILLVCYAGGLWIIWSAAMAAQMMRIRGGVPLAFTQVAMAACGTIEFCIPAYSWLTAAYRDRPPEIQQALHDFGWLPLDGMIQTVIWQNVAIGIAVLIDKRENPIFPRWYGYLSIWCAFLYLPASLNVFFHDGPLAWNGALAWWLLVGTVFPWMVTSVYLLFGAIRHQEEEEAALDGQLPPDGDLVRRLAAVEERLDRVGQRL